jgi:hypothetical protein
VTGEYEMLSKAHEHLLEEFKQKSGEFSRILEEKQLVISALNEEKLIGNVNSKL